MADVPKQNVVVPSVGGEYKNLSSSEAVKSDDGHLVGIFCASSSSGTCKIWDNTSAAATVLVNTFNLTAGNWYPLPFHFKVGCFVTIGGTADVTVSFH